MDKIRQLTTVLGCLGHQDGVEEAALSSLGHLVPVTGQVCWELWKHHGLLPLPVDAELLPMIMKDGVKESNMC